MIEPLDPDYTRSLWERALEAYIIAVSYNDFHDWVANRAYYTAFHAVSALFAAEGQYFRKHSALRAAVHRLLVKPGRFPVSIGDSYDRLLELRSKADYGAIAHTTPEEITFAISAAYKILSAVHNEYPDTFPLALKPPD